MPTSDASVRTMNARITLKELSQNLPILPYTEYDVGQRPTIYLARLRTLVA